MVFPAFLPFVGKILLLTVATAGSYFCLGILGLFFQLDDYPISLITPATGVALATNLLFGYRVLPGVYIGSFFLYAWAFNFNPNYSDGYLYIAYSSAISSALGTAFIKKTIGFPNPFLETRSIYVFTLSGALITSLLSASLTYLVMLKTNMVHFDGYFVPLVNGWLAELLGVLIFSPLGFIFFSSEHSIWHTRTTLVAFPVILLFILLMVLFSYLQNITYQQQAQQFKQNATHITQAFEDKLQIRLYGLYSFRNLLNNTSFENLEQFQGLLGQSYAMLKDIGNISLIDATENKVLYHQEFSHEKKSWQSLELSKITLPKSIQNELLLKHSEVDINYFIPGNDNIRIILPILTAPQITQKNIMVLSAVLSTEALFNEILTELNIDKRLIALTMSIYPAHKPIGSTASDDSKFDNGKDTNLKFSFDFINQTFLFNFSATSPKINGFNKKWLNQIVFYCFCFIALLEIILIYLSGRLFIKKELIAEHNKTISQTKASVERANSAKNHFLAKISHELRTPLNGIVGFTQILEKRPTLSQEDLQYIAIIKECSNNLLNLITDILDISAFEAKRITPEIKQFNFNPLISDLMHIFKLKADVKNLQLFEQNEKISYYLLGDEKRIRQIIINLIDNAIKYTKVGSVTVNTSHNGGKLEINISDTGCGIAQQDLRRIFTPFVQIKSKNVENDGVGLGLSIIKELVNVMEGSLKVRSRLGIGSEFKVVLPIHPSLIIDTDRSTLDVFKQNFAHKNILIVDDIDLNLTALKATLERLQANVYTAKNGEEALEMIAVQNFALALIDINMPIMNGIELVKYLRTFNTTLKLVAVSANAEKFSIETAMAAGFDNYLTKPIKEEDLIYLLTSEC